MKLPLQWIGTAPDYDKLVDADGVTILKPLGTWDASPANPSEYGIRVKPEDAAEIVRRCNAYDAMKDALKRLTDTESIINDKRGVETCTYCDNTNYHKDAPYCPLFMAHNALKLTEEQ